MGKSSLILLDTHALLWLLSDPQRLSPAARKAIAGAREGGDELAIADITFLEIATLSKKGRVGIEMDFASLFRAIETRFSVKPITGRACVKILELPPTYPKDPADRIIGAIALVEGIPLITADARIRRSKAVATIW